MSAYLMTETDTLILAAYAALHGLTTLPAHRAATTLRSANNAALYARYGDKRIPLSRGIKFFRPCDDCVEHITPQEIHQLTCTFAYQCCEGDVWETHKGAALLRKIQKHAADALQTSDAITKGEWI